MFNFESINFKATGGQLTKRDDWECYQWNIEIMHNGKFLNTQFYCGLGHVIKTKISSKPIMPKAPTIKDVMQSLLLDASANDESFNNWCANYGYDSDSLKAFNMYQQCCETANKLNKTFTRNELNEMREALQDY